jgi:uncharacterized protein (DUF1800 family)
MSNFNRFSRVSYGVTDKELKEIGQIGWKKWVKSQLTPGIDPVEKKIKNSFFQTSYYDKAKKAHFKYYDATARDLWSITQRNSLNLSHVYRPFDEVVAYTFFKQRYSKWQIYELIVEFWHNHFNVSGISEEAISLLFPIYDREVIRKNTLGNFSKLLIATAKSPCMLYYLDNKHSKKSHANENYAREIMELHTLGEDAYVNHKYKSQTEVPKLEDGTATGFIDVDIYELSKIFTGWTIGDRNWHRDGVLNKDVPASGDFFFLDKWHDKNSKQFLGITFPADENGVDEGIKAINLLAKHPQTAEFICKKLCTWFVADQPPKTIVEKAKKIWLNNLKSENQIAKVIEAIILSNEFEQNLGSKIKRPNVLMSSLFRTANMEFVPFADYEWYLSKMGYKQFYWGAPTGHPDNSTYWINPDMLLKRWNSISDAVWADDSYPNYVSQNWEIETPAFSKYDDLIQYWAKRLIGEILTDEQLEQVKKPILKDVDDTTLTTMINKYPRWYRVKLREIIAFIACSPQFQKR